MWRNLFGRIRQAASEFCEELLRLRQLRVSIAQFLLGYHKGLGRLIQVGLDQLEILFLLHQSQVEIRDSSHLNGLLAHLTSLNVEVIGLCRLHDVAGVTPTAFATHPSNPNKDQP